MNESSSLSPSSKSTRGSANLPSMNRFTTTYNSSYRPFDDTQLWESIYCKPIKLSNTLPSTNPVLTNQNLDTVPFTTKHSNFYWSIKNPTCANTATTSTISTTASSSINNGAKSHGNQCEPMGNREKSTNYNQTSQYTYRLNSNTNDRINNLLKKDYNIPNTLLTDKINLCSLDNYCDQTSSSSSTATTSITTSGGGLTSISNNQQQSINSFYCPPKPRTLSTISSLYNLPNQTEQSSFRGDILSKSNIISKRNLTISPLPSYENSYQLDFSQMFSQIARINNHLFLSSLNALTPDRLKQHGITLLISAMIDPPPIQLRNSVLNAMHIPVEDMEGANLRIHFDRVSDRIASEVRHGGKALIHCMAGVSRSSTLVLAYLVRHMNMSLADAYQHVRSIRPCIQPNPGFWRQLLEYEERIRGNRSVRLLPSVSLGNPTSRFISSSSTLSSSSSPYTSSNYQSRTQASSSYTDMFNRTTGDLIPYRPLASIHSMDQSKPFIGCRQPLG